MGQGSGSGAGDRQEGKTEEGQRLGVMTAARAGAGNEVAPGTQRLTGCAACAFAFAFVFAGNARAAARLSS
jgi:hypothetical protein